MRRRALLALPLAGLGGCAPTAQQQAAAFAPASSATAARARQSRLFETQDRGLMMQAALGALQDLGFTVEETQPEHGVVVGSKLSGARIRGQVVLRPAAERRAIVVRATFQRIVPRPGAMLAMGEVLDEPELYQGFFERLAQSAFLTAHEI